MPLRKLWPLAKRVLPEGQRKVLKKIAMKALRITRRDVDYFYDGEFSTSPLRNKVWTGDFCKVIIETFNPAAVIDFGCGTGDILLPFEERGLSILGIDASCANKKRSKIKEGNFLLFDLRNKYKSRRKYDLCFCFEVGEHIEERYSDTLIENLTRPGSTILFTASTSHEGIDHVNVKPHEWWIKKFQECNFEFNKQLTEAIQKEMRNIPGIQSWYVENLLVFKNTSCMYN